MPTREGDPGSGPASPGAREKLGSLERSIAGLGGCLVALSGGVDSSLLLAAAARAGGGRVLAVTVNSPLQPEGEVARASRVAERVGAEHRVLALDPLASPEVRANPPDRCYHCKRLILGALVELAREEGLPAVVEGSNADDELGHRPGRRAVAELGVRSPLAEAGLAKREIRELAAMLSLPSARAPSLACLASRIPYGEPLEVERLRRVDRAEAALRQLVAGQVRLRDHFPLARVEVEPEALAAIVHERTRGLVLSALRDLGYAYVTVDLQGYRSGAMDEVLSAADRKG